MQQLRNIKIEEVSTLLKRPAIDSDYLEGTVKNIIQRVKAGGDAALQAFNRQFDQVELEDLKVSEAELEDAERQLSKALKDAIVSASENIRKFHKVQIQEVQEIETMPGVTCWRKSVPINTVGLYIPGGTAPLFSTVLMLGVPAQLANCNQVVLCTPANRKGEVNPAILFAAKLTGIKQIFKVGGAQAIAAMALGTATIPKVDKIFGPGNQYVTKAKQLVNMEGVAIDMPAGPSEVAVIADQSADAEFIAADLLSQAEHGADSQVILITDSEKLAQGVEQVIESLLQQLPRQDVARECLTKSKVVLVKDMQEAIAISNAYAPEHLIINCADADKLAEAVTQAGSVFIGAYTPESAGDYASGTNHTLPTNGAASAYSGVSLDSFMKKITFQRISEAGLKNVGPIVEIMAEAEQLVAHKQAVSVRLKKLEVS